MVVVAAALGLTMAFLHRDIAFALGLVWALIRIAVPPPRPKLRGRRSRPWAWPSDGSPRYRV